MVNGTNRKSLQICVLCLIASRDAMIRTWVLSIIEQDLTVKLQSALPKIDSSKT